MKTSALIMSLIAGMALASSAHASDFVTNGNFSSLNGGLGELGYNTDATGWTTSGYNFVMNLADIGSSGQYGYLQLNDQNNSGNGWTGTSPTGDNFVALDGSFQTGPISQTITGLTAGQTYNLSFSYAFAEQYTFDDPTTQNLTTSFGSTSFTSANFNVPVDGFTGWQTYSGTVTADSPSDVLSFLASGTVGNPPFALFTDVSLTAAVPEPATWGMMIFGLGTMGLIARRRRRMVATAV